MHEKIDSKITNKYSEINLELQYFHIITKLIAKITEMRIISNSQNQRKTKKTKRSVLSSRDNIPNYHRWTQVQNFIYAKFLQSEEENFINEFQRRSSKIFLKMSRIIKTKNVNQCKSHHQKILSYCGSINKIIQKYLKSAPENDQVLQQLATKFVEQQTVKIQANKEENNTQICDLSSSTNLQIKQASFASFTITQQQQIFKVLNLNEEEFSCGNQMID